jgi:transcriptional regulator of arginine metabolism
MQKDIRHQLILKLVATQSLSTQHDLITALKDHQIHATQSSISRDIRALGLVKKSGFYQSPFPYTSLQTLNAQYIGYIKHLEIIGPHLLIIKSQPATAQAIASTLDQLHWPEIAGTIAGDDTIFVATRSENGAKSVMRRLRL